MVFVWDVVKHAPVGLNEECQVTAIFCLTFPPYSRHPPVISPHSVRLHISQGGRLETSKPVKSHKLWTLVTKINKERETEHP